jgi:D-alanyl-D-alanine carboxypeptidase
MISIAWRGLAMAVVGAAVLGGVLCAQEPAGEAVLRARVDRFFAALASGEAARYEAMAQQEFAPALLGERTVDERRQFVERIHNDFGTPRIVSARRRADDAIEVAFRGSGQDLSGLIELRVQTAAPFLIAGIGVRVQMGGGHGEPGKDDTSSPPPPISGSMSGAEMTRALGPYLDAWAAADSFAGAVLIAKDGVPVYQQAFGLADREAHVANTTATRFKVGSINKAFTRIAILQLIAAGKLALTDTIGHLLPDYPSTQASAKTATVDQLLNHRAGIADFFGPAFTAAPKGQFQSNADYYRFVAAQPLLFEPGTQTRYCNGCYIVLGAIVERVSQMRYEDYIAQRVFTPAGMTGAGFFHSDRLPPQTAIGYTRRLSESPGPGPGPAAGPSSGHGDGPGAGPGSGGTAAQGTRAALQRNTPAHGVAGSGAGGAYASVADLLALDTALREGRLLDQKMTGTYFGADAAATPSSGRARGGLGLAGGAPGVNGTLQANGVWTVVVLGNVDPPAAERLGEAIFHQLAP